MKSSSMGKLLAKVPAEIRQQVALERRVFENEKQAARAAKAYFSRFGLEEVGIVLTSVFTSDYVKRTRLFMRGGQIRFGNAALMEVAQ